MFVLGHLLHEIPLSLPYLIIGYMTNMCSSSSHLPYADIITSYLDSALVDISLGGHLLSAYNTNDMTNLKAMKYRYIHREQRWIREEDIPDGQHYEGYETLRLHHLHKQQSQQQSQQQQLPPPYPTFYGVAPPPDMSPSTVYRFVQLGYMHEYMTQTFTAIDTRLERHGD
ncbi:hypothetical protein Scep_021772 [Stephania cephalantha]|uniref:Uncharacterized protein n=1 Tax=Stephania cephalantha TaxID=152367 RepID=A0AAP0F957_9MAGN